MFGGPVADTTVDKVLAVLIGIGALDEDALDRAVEAWGDRGLA